MLKPLLDSVSSGSFNKLTQTHKPGLSSWSDEEIDEWESLINQRTRLRLNEKFTLKNSLNKEDYYKLVLMFGKDEVDSKQFAEFCNEHRSDIFVEHDGERFRHFDIVHSGGIQFLLSRYK